MKEITFETLNKVKRLQLKIFEYEDDESEYVNRRGVANCENALWYKVLKGYSDEEKRELLNLIKWYNDENATFLEKKGWKII